MPPAPLQPPANYVLVTGANGMLGRRVLNQLQQAGLPAVAWVRRANVDLQALTPHQLVADLTEVTNVHTYLPQPPAAIIHTAALTDVNRCEQDRGLAETVNAAVPRWLAAAFPHVPFVYISTDAVFDGQMGGRVETDTPMPVNVYAESKLAGEQAVCQSSRQPYVIRTNLYGFHVPLGQSLAEWGLRALKTPEEPMFGFTNMTFNPLYAGQLAQLCVWFCQQQPQPGLYHAGAAQVWSKHRFLQQLAQVFGLSDAHLQPRQYEQPTDQAPRPLTTELNTDKLAKAGYPPPPFADGLHQMHADFFATFNAT